ncbi:MAG TPA: S41 family peptidase [Candidatus Saccharimonadales bacterium]|nr:S41 family peptidase [Candidatus Saccharimonadales bacterium]
MERDKKPKFNSKIIRSLAVIILVFFAGVLIGAQNPSLLDNLDKDSAQNRNLPKQLDYSGVEEIYSKLRKNFDGKLDPTELQNGLKAGLVKAAGDPYTEYLDAEESKAFNEDLNGSFEGIGAELSKEDQSIVIVSPIAGFPAAKAGLKAGDIITEINGESAFDINLTEAVQKIRGPKGTAVKLGIIRDGDSLDIEIKRATITIPSVESETLAGNIGVIRISRFGGDTVGLASKYARQFRDKQVNGVILDLRGNPGGLLDAAIGISDLWLKQGDVILQEKSGGRVINTAFAQGNPVLDGIPTVVLIDEGSASASEIVAGALKDNDAATLIGQKSYGKGSVQEVIDLGFGGELKVTVARWYTPDGRNIDKEGITPDQRVELTDADTKADRDPQQAAAIKFLNK